MKGNVKRNMCAAMLTMQAIVLGLSIPVMITVENVSSTTAGWIGGGLAVACLAVTAMLRKPWAYVAGHLLQVATIATGFLVPIMFLIGIMFAALWLGAFGLGRKIEADKARWAAQEADE